MALKAYTDTLDDIDASLHEHYVEKDGGFYLSLDDFGKHPGAMTLKNTLNKVNREKEAFAAKAQELETKVSQLPDDFEIDEWERLKAGDSGKIDEVVQAERDRNARAVEALKGKYTSELEALSNQVAERDAYIDRTLVDGGLKDSLLEVGVKPELLEGALASLRGGVKVQKNEDGSRAAIVETDLGDVGVSDFVKEWAGGKGKAYLGKPSGPAPSGNNGSAHNRASGSLGGDASERKAAIASRFPELGR